MKSASLTQRILILFAGGALGGTLGDLCHVLSDTDGYPLSSGWQPLGLGIPYWVPALFGTAGLAIGMSHPWAESWVGAPKRPRPGLKNGMRVGAGLACLLTTWAASGFLSLATGGAKDALIGALAAGAWWFWDRTGSGLAFALVTAALGTGFEISQVRAGTFYYTTGHQNLWGVPSWLPSLYCCASVTVGNLGRCLARAPTQAS